MKSTSGWTNAADRCHTLLLRAVAGRQGAVMRTSEIRSLVDKVPGVGADAQFAQPPDHCVNIRNAGACECAETDRSLFKHVRRGVYLVR